MTDDEKKPEEKKSEGPSLLMMFGVSLLGGIASALVVRALADKPPRPLPPANPWEDG